MSRTDLLKKLTTCLTIYSKHVEKTDPATISLTYDLKNLNSPEEIEHVKKSLDYHGVIFIINAISSDQTLKIKDRLVSAYNQMFGAEMHNLPVTSVAQIPSTIQAGLIANKGFAYLYKQPLKKTEIPSIEIDGLPAYMDHNPIYSRVNLATLMDPENRHMLSVLLALTHPIKTMISWDSAKVSTNPKAKMNPFTIPHIDFYNDATQRFQVILNVAEASTKLFYCPGTNDPEVRELMKQLQADPKFYAKDGFKALKTDVATAIRPYMVAPPPGALIFWRSGIVHAEFTATPTPRILPEGLFKPDPHLALKQKLNQLTIRLVVGTHIPTNLSPDALEKLAVASLNGIIPHRYIHGNSAVVLNKMHKGATQYKVCRPLPPKEKEIMTITLENANSEDYTETYLKSVDPILKHLLGINLSEADLWPELKQLLPK